MSLNTAQNDVETCEQPCVHSGDAAGGAEAPNAPSRQSSDQPVSPDQGAAAPGFAPPVATTPRVTVIGVGGAGGNAVNTMITRRLDGVDYLVANTDAQALEGSMSERRLQLGVNLTRGLGAGCKPEIGAKAAEESAEAIAAALEGAHMCFIAAGMGGGTGTGAAPVIARIARENGVLCVGVVSKPFDFEGPRKAKIAEEGVAELERHVDTLIVIPNQNLFRVANEATTFADAFLMSNEVLHQGVKGVTDLMMKPGLVNLDFADVRAVIDEMGSAMMGTGESEGENRAIEAAERAVDNPLLDEITLKGAKGVLINITGGPDLKLYEVDAAANRVRQDADPEANVFFGSTIEPEMEGRIRVSVVATGIVRGSARRALASAETPSVRPAPAPAPAPEQAAPPLRTDGSAVPQEPQIAGQAPERQDDLVRKLAETLAKDVSAASEAVSDAVGKSGAEIADRSAPARAPRDSSRVEIPSFLRRHAN